MEMALMKAKIQKENTLVNGKTVFSIIEDYKIMKMDLHLKDNSMRTKKMVKEKLYITIEPIIKENFMMMRSKESAFTWDSIINMKGSGKMGKCMVLEKVSGLTKMEKSTHFTSESMKKA
jgi:hypothetical protein